MQKYAEIARSVRKEVLALIHKGQTSHIASCFSLVDIAVVLYENLKEKDEVIWSKGWASALYYIIAARRGVIDKTDLFNTFPNKPYPALLEPPTPGVYLATGSVGHGLGFAVGIAYAKKLKGEEGTVYCVMSDGELNEGSVWEAAMMAGHHKLDNLVAIIDANGWQAMGRTKDIANFNPHKVFEGFGWTSLSRCDGHDFEDIKWYLDFTPQVKGPKVVIAETIKGKGVSFMEDHLLFHYKHVDDETYEKALAELNNA
jgi:transketolase